MAAWSFRLDYNEGVTVCQLNGFLDRQQAETFADEWAKTVVESRLRFVRLKVLFDNTAGGVISPETYQIIADKTRDLVQADDRTAVLVSSSLSKMQAKRTVTNGGKVFFSERDARVWLSSFD